MRNEDKEAWTLLGVAIVASPQRRTPSLISEFQEFNEKVFDVMKMFAPPHPQYVFKYSCCTFRDTNEINDTHRKFIIGYIVRPSISVFPREALARRADMNVVDAPEDGSTYFRHT